MAARAKDLVPRCDVVRCLDIDGPRGGNIRVLILSCGSRTWRRQRPDKPPPASTPCTSCYVERKIAEAGAALHTVHVLRAGRTLCGFGREYAFPKNWPPGHLWTRAHDMGATCVACIAVDQPVAES